MTDEGNKKIASSNEEEASNPQDQHSSQHDSDEDIIETMASLVDYKMYVNTEVHKIKEVSEYLDCLEELEQLPDLPEKFNTGKF